MKKLNRKGFTLVELLAVIVILAIVVGIAIPSVTKVINATKKKGFETALEAAGVYLTKQAQLFAVDASTMDDDFRNKVRDDAKYFTLNDHPSAKRIYEKLGLKTEDVRKIQYRIRTNTTACIMIVAIPKTSKYYTANDWVEITEEESTSGTYVYRGLAGYYKYKYWRKAIYGPEGCETIIY